MQTLYHYSTSLLEVGDIVIDYLKSSGTQGHGFYAVSKRLNATNRNMYASSVASRENELAVEIDSANFVHGDAPLPETAALALMALDSRLLAELERMVSLDFDNLSSFEVEEEALWCPATSFVCAVINVFGKDNAAKTFLSVGIDGFIDLHTHFGYECVVYNTSCIKSIRKL